MALISLTLRLRPSRLFMTLQKGAPVFKSIRLIICIAMLSVQVFAGAKKAKLEDNTILPVPPPPEAKHMTDAEYQAMLKEYSKPGIIRKVAQSDRFDQTALTAEFKNLRSRMIGGPVWKNDRDVDDSQQPYRGVNTAHELTTLIADVEQKYATFSASDAKFLAAQIIALKPLQSFVFRCRDLVDNSRLSKSILVTMLRSVRAGADLIFPDSDPQANAVFDFFMTPTDGRKGDIANDSQFSDFLTKEAYPALQALQSRIDAIDFSKGFYFDNAVFNKNVNFASDKDRFLMFGPREKLGMQANLNFNLSGLAYVMAYNLKGLFLFNDSISRIYGFDSMKWDVDGATAEARATEFAKYPQLFVKRPGGEAWTKESYRYLTDGLDQAESLWRATKPEIKDNPVLVPMIDVSGYGPFVRPVDEVFKTFSKLIHNDKDGVKSAVFGTEAVEVNFSTLFDSPPETFHAFAPKKFRNERTTQDKKYMNENTPEKYRNYRYGEAISWDYTSYQKYFPQVNDDKSLKQAVRVMNQAWGGWLLGVPMASFAL